MFENLKRKVERWAVGRLFDRIEGAEGVGGNEEAVLLTRIDLWASRRWEQDVLSGRMNLGSESDRKFEKWAFGRWFVRVVRCGEDEDFTKNTEQNRAMEKWAFDRWIARAVIGGSDGEGVPDLTKSKHMVDLTRHAGWPYLKGLISENLAKMSMSVDLKKAEGGLGILQGIAMTLAVIRSLEIIDLSELEKAQTERIEEKGAEERSAAGLPEEEGGEVIGQ